MPEPETSLVPWEDPHMDRKRLREMRYQFLSWPYIISFLVTVLFFACVIIASLRDMATLVAAQMGIMWAATWVRREVSKVTDAKAEQIRGNGLPKVTPGP